MSFVFFSMRICAVLIAMALSSCGGDSDYGPPSSTLQQPTTIDLYPVQSSSSGPRFLVMVTAVGTHTVNMPLVFDTGSAGITLYAPDVLPSSMVSSSGFVFGAGQASLTYGDITVTNVTGSREYGGGSSARHQIGNLGFANVTFGDANGTLTTRKAPVFFYYSIVADDTGVVETVPAGQRGVFGVNTMGGLVEVEGSTEPPGGYTECDSSTATSCRVVSAFKYLDYAPGVDAGFELSPAALQSCDITSGTCAASPILTVGLNSSLLAGFNLSTLTCPPSDYVGPATIENFPICQATIADSTVTVSGAVNDTFSASPLFDTGNPAVALVDPNLANSTSLPAGTQVLIQLPSGFNFQYTASATGPASTSLNNSGATGIGIEFFTTHGFLIDFSTSSEGWK